MISPIYNTKSEWQLKPPQKVKPVYSFLKRTLENTDLNKDIVRRDTHRIFINFFSTLLAPEITIATMPGLTWDFEKAIRSSLFSIGKHANITGYEIDMKVFNASSMYMLDADLKTKIFQGVGRYSGEHFIYQKKSGMMLWNMDLYSGTNSEDSRFLHAIWYDTTGTVFSFLEKFEKNPPRVGHNSIIAITVLKGREHGEIIVSRTNMISSVLTPIGFSLIYETEYFDSSPMLHLIYKRELRKEFMETV